MQKRFFLFFFVIIVSLILSSFSYCNESQELENYLKYTEENVNKDHIQAWERLTAQEKDASLKLHRKMFTMFYEQHCIEEFPKLEAFTTLIKMSLHTPYWALYNAKLWRMALGMKVKELQDYYVRLKTYMPKISTDSIKYSYNTQDGGEYIGYNNPVIEIVCLEHLMQLKLCQQRGGKQTELLEIVTKLVHQLNVFEIEVTDLKLSALAQSLEVKLTIAHPNGVVSYLNGDIITEFSKKHEKVN